MKAVTFGVAGAVLFASASFAQTPPSPPAPAASANCSGFAAPPTFPDGAAATAAQMNGGNERYQAWANERVARLQACRADIEALRVQLNALEVAYNGGNGELDTTTRAWQAEVEEFNGRGAAANGGRRERGGVLTRPD